MKNYSLSHLTDGAVLSGLSAIVARDRGTTAEMLAHIAEVDARKLYLPAAHPSMFSYCIHELRLSEQAALKRICVARTARQFPAIFAAVADGRLHLSTIIQLKPYLTESTACELLNAAANKGKSEVERLLAERFPKPDVPAGMVVISSQPSLSAGELSAGRVHVSAGQLSAGRVEAPSPSQIAPLAPERFALKLTIGQEAHDELRYVQSLLGLSASADLPEVISRAIHELVIKLEKQKFAATNRPRTGASRSSTNPRFVPAPVKRAVVERDGGQCTFVSEAGRRCSSCDKLEFDHIVEVARGGEASIANLRLRCRAHNQYAAEQSFGTEFMKNKRQQARLRAAKAMEEATPPSERTREQDAALWFRNLACLADESRRSAGYF